jgi:hypothetical protein
MHNNNSDLLLDMYIDRTFHWNADVNKILEIIPYTKSWIGFVHHTFDTSFSDYNCDNLLKSPDFLESLKMCKGLIVLSRYLKDKFDEELGKIGYSEVPVYALTHPTDTSVASFSMTDFLNNEDKKIVHVGGWLRNIYTFYNMTLPNSIKFCYGRILGDSFGSMLTVTSLKFRKVALRGKSMNNYYPSNHFLDDIHNFLVKGHPHYYSGLDNKNISVNASQNVSQNASQNVSQNVSHNASQNTSQNTSQNVSCPNISQSNCIQSLKIKNNWYKFFYEDLCDKFKSIDFVDFLDNSTYDTLLTQNIIFVHLVDASAINTVIECIARNTPIIINKHPAVVELLGEEYPLYFSDSTRNYTHINNDVSDLLTDSSRIKKAHVYLKKLDKRKISITQFVNDFIRIIETVGSADLL